MVSFLLTGSAVQTIDYAKQIFELFGKGKEPIVNYVAEGANSTVEVINGDKINNYYGPVYNIAPAMLPHLQALTSMLEQDGVDEIKISDKAVGNDQVYFNKSHKSLFNLPTDLDKIPKSIQAEIYSFDKFKHSGKVKVHT